jgi:hypothetical protein
VSSSSVRGGLLLVVVLTACTGRRGIDPIDLPDGGLDAAGSDAFALSSEGGVDGSADDAREAGGDAAVDPGPAVSALLDVICDARLGAACAAPWDCGCPDLGARPDAAACVSERRADCRASEGAGLEISVVADRVRIDEASLALCQQTLEEAWESCVPLVFAQVSACRHARVSQVPIGGLCTGPSLCADGAGLCDEGGVCVRAPMRDTRCDTNECAAGLACFDSLCTLPRGDGLSCGDHEDCASPLLCLGGLCGSIAAVGASCGSSDECAVDARCTGSSCVMRAAGTCLDDAGCGNLTSCIRPGVRRCVALGGAGAECADDAGCTSDLACDPDTRVCGAIPAAGEDCFSRCAAGLFCDFGTCVAQAAAGAACPFDSAACAAGLACVDGTCGDPPVVAMRCAEGRVCASGLTCIDESGGPTCEVPHPLGGSCGARTDCASGLACIAGTCAERVASGGECFASEDCELGLACAYDDVSGTSRCGAAPATSEICADVCTSGARCVDLLDPGACLPGICSVLLL